MQSHDGDRANNTRSLAGLILKNNIRIFYNRFPQPIREYIKRCVSCLFDYDLSACVLGEPNQGGGGGGGEGGEGVCKEVTN